jgi:hypothetical protein
MEEEKKNGRSAEDAAWSNQPCRWAFGLFSGFAKRPPARESLQNRAAENRGRQKHDSRLWKRLDGRCYRRGDGKATMPNLAPRTRGKNQLMQSKDLGNVDQGGDVCSCLNSSE